MRRTSLKTRLAAGILCLLILLALAVWASIPVTPPTVQISADTAANSVNPVGGTWTSMGDLRFEEDDKGEIGLGQVTLTAPSGFEFNTAAPVVVRVVIGGNDSQNINRVTTGGVVAANGGTLTVTDSIIRFNVFDKSNGNAANRLRWEGIQIRPIAGGPLLNGDITIALPNTSTNQRGTVMGTVQMTVGAAAKVVTLLPGQTLTSGVGVTNTQSPVTAGTAFNLSKLVVTDQFLNRTTYTATNRTINYTGPNKICSANPNNSYTVSNVNFSAGESTTNLVTNLYAASTNATITSTISGTTYTGVVSSPLTVLSGAVTKLFVTLPGQTLACGINSGTASNQSAGAAFPITLSATDAYFNIANNPLNFPFEGNKATIYEGPSGPTTTSTPVNFSGGVATTQTTIANAQSNTYWKVTAGGLQHQSSNFNVVGASVGAFNAFETATAAGAASGRIKTKIAGSPFSLDLVALDGANAISPSFSGSVTVQVVDASDTSFTCSGWTTVATLAPLQVFSGTPSSRITTSSITVANAYRNARIRIRYTGTTPETVACSNDNFAIRPSKFGPILVSDATPTTAGITRTLQTASLATAAVNHRAGRPFSISAAAQNGADAVLNNYTGTPVATISSCASAASDACTATLGTLNTGTWGAGASAGYVSTSTATYSEVGSFTLSLQDRTFADVDIDDTLDADRYFASGVTTIAGRFTPDYFLVGSGTVRNRAALPLCSASAFSNMAEAFTSTFTVTAKNASGVTTENYAGVRARLDPGIGNHLNFGAINEGSLITPLTARITAITKSNPGRVTTSLKHGFTTGTQIYLAGIGGMDSLNNKLFTVIRVDDYSFDLNGTDGITTGLSDFVAASNSSASRLAFTSGIGTWSAGVLTATSTLVLSRQLAPDGPFDAVSLGILPVDPDGVKLLAGNLNTDNDGPEVSERALVGTTKLRFGRLALRPSYGSQLLDLRIPMEAQHFNGSGFIVNTDDSCTTIANGFMRLDSYTTGSGISNSNLPQSNLPTTVITKDGKANILLRRPTSAPTARGGALLTIYLTPTIPTLPPATSPPGANLPHLLGNWTSSTVYDSNPSVRVTFGNYRATPVIYAREVF